MRPVYIGGALAIIVMGIVGIALAPRERSSVPPGTIAGPPSAATDPTPKRRASGTFVSPQADSAGPASRPLRTRVHVIEQDSPAIDQDGMLTQAIGIEMPRGRFTPVLEAGSYQPVWKAKTYGVARADQTQLSLHIVRGNADRMAGNHSLGWIRLSGFRAGAEGLPAVAVAFRVADGNIVLGAVDANTRQPIAIEMIESPIAR